MIEVVSSPSDLSKWRPEEQPFYFELYGEANPLVDEAHAEVIPSGGTDPKNVADAPVYEYWWTIGHPGAPEEHRHWFDEKQERRPWQEVADPAVRVYVYFPVSAGWRVNEIVATLKYLSPVPEQSTWLETASRDFQAVQPLLANASSVAELVPGAGTASKWLSTIAKLQISSLPQTGDLKWSVGKVTFGSEYGVMQGIMWTIPRSVFQRLGGRLTGSVAVSFIPARIQGNEDGAKDGYEPAEILAHAVVYSADEKKWWCPPEGDGRGFVKLKVSPKSPRPLSSTETK